ncbi:MAG: hypothetical protein ABW219_14680 [Ilumatobacteraceae bacterium]
MPSTTSWGDATSDRDRTALEDLTGSVLAPLAADLPRLRETSVDLHRHPQLSGLEVRTAGIVPP